MGQRGKLGSHLNGSNQFAIDPCLMTPIYYARKKSLQVKGENYGGVQENILWQATIAKGGTPFFHV